MKQFIIILLLVFAPFDWPLWGEASRINGVIEKLAAGQPIFGIFSQDWSLANAAALADWPLAFVMVDREHPPLDFQALRKFLQGMINRRGGIPITLFAPRCCLLSDFLKTALSIPAADAEALSKVEMWPSAPPG